MTHRLDDGNGSLLFVATGATPAFKPAFLTPDRFAYAIRCCLSLLTITSAGIFALYFVLLARHSLRSTLAKREAWDGALVSIAVIATIAA